MNNDKSYINIENLFVTINKKTIINNVSIQFQKGMIHGLVGRNGSGKTMLMKCICGFVRATQGTISVDNKIVGKDIDFPDKLGLIIETPGFIPYYSGYRNLKILAGISEKLSKQVITRYMDKVGLDPHSHLAVGKYSLGMRQRLGIAQAIMGDPDILILDEPFNGLDWDGVVQMRDLFMKLKYAGKTIIMASHNREDIDVLCDTVHEMCNGSVTSKT